MFESGYHQLVAARRNYMPFYRFAEIRLLKK